MDINDLLNPIESSLELKRYTHRKTSISYPSWIERG